MRSLDGRNALETAGARGIDAAIVRQRMAMMLCRKEKCRVTGCKIEAVGGLAI